MSLAYQTEWTIRLITACAASGALLGLLGVITRTVRRG